MTTKKRTKRTIRTLKACATCLDHLITSDYGRHGRGWKPDENPADILPDYILNVVERHHIVDYEAESNGFAWFRCQICNITEGGDVYIVTTVDFH